MRRRRVLLWVVLACLLAPVALYALLPTAAVVGLKYFLHRQGYYHVTMQLGYPGWHTLHVPVLSFQKDLDGESLSVTVQDSRLEYDVWALFSAVSIALPSQTRLCPGADEMGTMARRVRHPRQQPQGQTNWPV